MATLVGVRGIVSWGTHLPHRRLDRSEIATVAGRGGGTGTRSVASYDEDATTMAVAAGRAALAQRSDPGAVGPDAPGSLWFVTTAPPYLDKTNATAVHAALRLPRATPAYDAIGAVRSALGCLRIALAGPGLTLVTAADLRTGLAGSPDETDGGDGAAALLAGQIDDDDDDIDQIVAEFLGGASSTEEFTDRWRPPTQATSRVWEERFGETRYLQVGFDAWNDALAATSLDARDIDHLIITSTHTRAARTIVAKLGVPTDRVVDDLSATIGNTGAAAPALLLASALETAGPDQRIALVSLADGADVLLFRTTGAIDRYRDRRRRARSVADQISSGAPIPYGTFLSWRGLLAVEPPRRPEPARPSSAAAARSTDWKYGFVASTAPASTDPAADEPDPGKPDAVHLPPDPNDAGQRPMASAIGSIATFTVDRLAYSPSPPVIFAVVDFEGGGRLPIELTDVDVDELEIGLPIELTFRKLFTSDGIHNYFWKGRPARPAHQRPKEPNGQEGD